MIFLDTNMNGVKEKRELPIPEAPPVTSADKPGLISITIVLLLLLLLLLLLCRCRPKMIRTRLVMQNVIYIPKIK